MARTAVIAGVGPGLGASIARKFVAEGCDVGLFARSPEFIENLADELADEPGDALVLPTDVTDPEAVAEGFDAVRDAFGPVDVLVNHASAAGWKGVADLSIEEFERALAVGARGGFLCSQEAVADMLDREDGADDTDDKDENGGTVIFTGATSAVRGNKDALGFSAAKFAGRGMAESMARDLGPQGIHVAHVVIDGGILIPSVEADSPEEFLDPDAIAESYWHLVEQDRSAWTLELDLRPHVEEFYNPRFYFATRRLRRLGMTKAAKGDFRTTSGVLARLRRAVAPLLAKTCLREQRGTFGPTDRSRGEAARRRSERRLGRRVKRVFRWTKNTRSLTPFARGENTGVPHKDI